MKHKFSFSQGSSLHSVILAVAFVCGILGASLAAHAASFTAPPSPPDTATNTAVSARRLVREDVSSDFYSIGSPTDEEQMYLELINRARANPTLEVGLLFALTNEDIVDNYSFFQVDTNLAFLQFSLLAPAPPLSMNSRLTAGARLHSGDMFTNVFQGHISSDGRVLTDRVGAQDYDYLLVGENVYATADSVIHGHAGFEIDWGTNASTGLSVGGMQSPAGHRQNIHSPNFREIGIGVIDGTNTNGLGGEVGPQLVTQDFGVEQSSVPFVTGVVYYDLNGNNYYDVGEGIGGYQVSVSAALKMAMSATSGGYSIPVSTNGQVTVTFSYNGVVATQQVVTVSNLANVKVDYVPVYHPPQITTNAATYVGLSNVFNFTTVPGAVGYEWRQTVEIPSVAVEGAEQGLTNVTTDVTPGYNLISRDFVSSGTNSFQLTHYTPPDSDPQDQYVQLKRLFLVATNSQLIFASRLGIATSNQIAKAQISTNGGNDWVTVWSERGFVTNGLGGDSSFTKRTNSLAAYAGREIQVRFAYLLEPLGTSFEYYPGTNKGIGFYFDDVRVTNSTELANRIINTAANGSFSFTPTATATYALQVRPIMPSQALLFGPVIDVPTVQPPPAVMVTRIQPAVSNQTVLDFQLIRGIAKSYQLEASTNFSKGWTSVVATITTNTIPFRATVAKTTNGARYFRIKITP